MTETQTCFISLVRGALLGEEKKTLPEGVKEKDLYKMAQWHSVTAAVASQIENPKDKRLAEEETEAQTLCRMQDKALGEILSAFNDIMAIPLQGIVYKNLWQKPHLRQMCDIDLLISKDDALSCRNTMRRLGYEALVTDKGRTLSFTKAPYLNVVLHLSLYPAGSGCNRIFRRNSFFIDTSDYPFRRMKARGQYAMICANLLHAFVGGGIGVRQLCDFWLWHHTKEHYHKSLVRAYFEDIGMGRFLDNLEHLTEVWFGDATPDEVTEKLGEYILSLGEKPFAPRKDFKKPVWGSFNRVFLPLKEMQLRYPVLSTRPKLLFFCHLHRFFVVLCHRRANYSHYWNLSMKKGQLDSELVHTFGL